MPTQQEFAEKFEKLPQRIKEIMLSSETAETNRSIGTKYKLSIEQTGDMVSVIVDTILKDIPLENFVAVLQQKLGIDLQTSQRLTLDIVIKRFLPIKEYLPGTETLIQKLGGNVPKTVPPSPSSASPNIVNLKNK